MLPSYGTNKEIQAKTYGLFWNATRQQAETTVHCGCGPSQHRHPHVTCDWPMGPAALPNAPTQNTWDLEKLAGLSPTPTCDTNLPRCLPTGASIVKARTLSIMYKVEL